MRFRKKHGLSPQQGQDLAFRITHALHDLSSHKKAALDRNKRAALVRRLKALEMRTAALRRELSRASTDLELALPSATRLALTQLLRRSAMATATGGKLPVWLKDKDVENLSLIDEEALAFKCGTTFFKHIIVKIDESLKSWLLENNSNRGGKRVNAERIYLLKELTRFSVQTMKAKPTASGRFKSLCMDSFQFLGLDHTAMKDAIDRLLRTKEKNERGHQQKNSNNTNAKKLEVRRRAIMI
jgi:hypothetical protein